ncbi:putative bifunctional diguanylate cyclase/phosphodiesterase [Devosia submarina]|uniref:putative bifunctional diguanylate cyclase/phosphodiesterase n=1 Tax=Devosia submarina TaxID=1173082 RepID=UPI000D34CF8C|nr:EAL domain-containing protein [Devosia submarina]
MSSLHPTGSTSTRSIAFVSLALALALVMAFVMAAWWAVDKIDTRELLNERQSIAAGLVARKNRIAQEQDSSAVGDDAVVNLRANNQPWIARNLADWMSQFFSHDRVYVLAPDDRVVRAAEAGEQIPSIIDLRDRAVVEPIIAKLREKLAVAANEGDASMAAPMGTGNTDTVRLPSNELAYVSVRPIVPSSGAVVQRPGEEFLVISVVALDGDVLGELGQQLGLPDLRIGGPGKGKGALPVVNNAGRTMGFAVWTPKKPALVLMQETAPATLGLLLVGGLSLFGFLMWLRRTMSALEKSQAQIEYLAFHDPLTGVANRALFDVRLRNALHYEYLAKAKVALVSIDLDTFKEINDSLGHGAGDELIKQVAKRLSSRLPEGATLTRLGGDEFAVVQPGVVSEGHARFLCQTLLDTFHDPFLLAGEYVRVTASMGLALESGEAVSSTEIMRRADVALYAVKAAGRDGFRCYEQSMDQSRRDKRTLEIDLRNALVTNSGLHLLYQPIFDAVSSAIVGAEALVRWEHPTRGNLTPDLFISVAEEQGVIERLGLWVLNEACRFAANSALPWVAVNVSPLQFNNAHFAQSVLDVLRAQNLPPHRLQIEITEGLLLQNSPVVRASLESLRANGIAIALDDFGTGYSSIGYLRNHSIDKLKIDRSFTQLIGRDKATETIVQSVVEMAEALGMTVTAEGVEDDLQRHTLVKLGCATLQGYLLSRPIAGERLEDLLASDLAGASMRKQPALR